jgi:hypothetical protein
LLICLIIADIALILFQHLTADLPSSLRANFWRELSAGPQGPWLSPYLAVFGSLR